MSDFFHDSEILAEGWTPVSPDDANRLLWHLRRVKRDRAKVEITDEPGFLVWALDNDHRLLSIAPSKSMLAGLRHRPHDELEDCTVEMLVTSDGVEVPGVALVTAKAPNVSVVSAS